MEKGIEIKCVLNLDESEDVKCLEKLQAMTLSSEFGSWAFSGHLPDLIPLLMSPLS